MRNWLIIAGCAALVLVAALLILFGGNMFGSEADEARRAESEERTRDRDAGAGPEDGTGDRAARFAPSSPGDAKPAARSDLPAQLAEAARQINAGGPIRIDPMTMMTAASAEGNRITYRYEISQRLTPQQTASFRELAASDNPRVLCARPETRAMIEMGGEVEYEYFDPTGRRLFSTPVTSC